MKIIIAGATGFIGGALSKELAGDYDIVALTRNVQKVNQILGSTIKCIQWDGISIGGWAGEIEGAKAVINLCGEGVAEKRWTKERKRKIQDSRLNSTEVIVRAIQNAGSKPEVLIQASAMAWYGSKGDIEADENSPSGEGFLAKTCQMCEAEIEPVKEEIRTCIIRLGVVMGKNGGMLSRLMTPFKYYIGGYIGTGKQYVPWISMTDTTSAVKYLIENKKCNGPYNLTAPEPEMIKELCSEVGKILNKPSWTVMPSFAARLIYGEMAEELLLSSFRIVPKRLVESGFKFKHNTVKDALAELLGD